MFFCKYIWTSLSTYANLNRIPRSVLQHWKMEFISCLHSFGCMRFKWKAADVIYDGSELRIGCNEKGKEFTWSLILKMNLKLMSQWRKKTDCCTGYWDSKSQRMLSLKCDGQGWRRVRTSGAPSCSLSEDAKEADVENGEEERSLKQGQSAKEEQRTLKESKGRRGEQQTNLRCSQQKKIRCGGNQKKRHSNEMIKLWISHRYFLPRT